MFSSSTYPWSSKGLSVVRIMVGLLIFFHGIEVFDSELMNEYSKWGAFNSPFPKLIVYAGKSAEFLTGVLLTLGVLTRPVAVLIIITFSGITFFVGSGRFWYEDQHPFMFAVFGLLFYFTGPGEWSAEQMIRARRNSRV